MLDVSEKCIWVFTAVYIAGDDKCEVPITNVAKIPFPGGKSKGSIIINSLFVGFQKILA